MAQSPISDNPTSLLPSIKASLAPGTFSLLEAIALKATGISMPLYLVGGSVRDMLLATPVKDLDLVVEGEAAVLASEVANGLRGNVLAHPRFGTATVNLQGQRFDFATTRQETYARPGALPKVSSSTILEDLRRRDFSINALAIPLVGPDAGRLLDPPGHRQDVSLGLIRVLHNGSFRDDPTRILRAIRYEQRLNFKLEPDTAGLLAEALEEGLLSSVSGARIRRELELMFQEPSPNHALSRCGELGVLRAIHPGLGDGSWVKELAGRGVEITPMEYLAALSYPLAAEEGEAFIHRLHMSSKWAEAVKDTIALRLGNEGWPSDDLSKGLTDITPGQLCRLLDRFSPGSVRVNALLSESPEHRWALNCYLTELRYVKPFLNGRDLIALGVDRGPAVGELLAELRNARLDGRVSNRDQEIDWVGEYLRVKGARSID